MASSQPLKSIRLLVQTYLRNRAEFYATLLPRVPDPQQRRVFEEATCPAEGPADLTAAVESLPDTASDDEPLRALGLRDALKKDGFGFAFGRTAISTVEALQRAQFMEETGVLLFSHLPAEHSSLAEVFGAELRRRRRALAALLTLEDGLRYHRFHFSLD